jgi:hypothetical protein
VRDLGLKDRGCHVLFPMRLLWVSVVRDLMAYWMNWGEPMRPADHGFAYSVLYLFDPGGLPF